MFKRYVALIAVCAISVSLVSCSKKVDNQNGEATNVSLLFMEGGNTPYKADWLILQEIEQKQKVKLELQVVPGKDYDQKRAIVFASGEIPDIVVNTWPDQMSQFAMDGVLLPVSDHLNKLPNLKKRIEDWNLQDTINNISEMDGKFYILPDLRQQLSGSQCFGIREDIFKANNLPVPTTYDELHDVLVKIKKLYPETLGIGELFNGAHLLSFIAESFNTNGGFSLPWGYSYHYETKEWYYAPTSNEYKDLVTYMNRLYKDGCLDPEAFTQDQTQYGQKVSNSKYMIFPINGPSDAKSQTKALVDLGNKDAKVTALYPLAGPTGLRKVKPSSKNQGGNAMPASVAKRKDFNKVMAFCDWLYYSDEGSIMSAIGTEGVTYDMVDGKYVMKPEVKTAANPTGTIQMNKEYGFGLFGLTSLVPDATPEEVKQLTADPDQYAFNKYIKDNDMTTQDDPIIKFTPEQRERIKLLTTTLNDYTKQMRMKFIFGQEPLEKWDSFVQECNNKGAQELMDIVNKAWAENNKK